MKVAIIGIRGIPAAHGGFETFAERLALDLVRRGSAVDVYCQGSVGGVEAIDTWRGVRRIHIPVATRGALATMEFDWRSISHVLRVGPDVVLTLGYNTALFCKRLSLAGIRNVINMDGIEWRRDKWGRIAKLWFRVNEGFGARLGDVLVADHPAIAEHLDVRHAVSRKTAVIPYGADEVFSWDPAVLESFGVSVNRYFTIVARPEPENSIVQLVSAFSRRERRSKLLVLGAYDENNSYHASVKALAGPNVIFPGPIYDRVVLGSVRSACRAYFHGHTVGGTNPSLVEALGAGSAVLAHDNVFNRWVADGAALYFRGAEDADSAMGQLDGDDDLIEKLKGSARRRFASRFTWERVLDEYFAVLSEKQLPVLHP